MATANAVFNNVSFTAQDTADVVVSLATPTPTPTPVAETPTPTPVAATPTPTPEQIVQAGTPAPSLPNSATSPSDGSSPVAAVFILIALGTLVALPVANVAVARRRR